MSDGRQEAAIEGLAEGGSPAGGMFLGAAMCIASMACIQFGSALSAPALAAHGPMGTTWLRLSFAALLLCLVVRPRLARYSWDQWKGALLLGVTTVAMTVCFFSAMQRIPLGLAVAIDFLGPLAVATFGYGLSRRLFWPLLAGAGVLLLAHDGEGWTGNFAGVLFAFGAATGWACYILLTKRVGAAFQGFEGLAISLAVSAIVATPFGFADGLSGISLEGLLGMAGLAILVPLLPYTLEMTALRRMPTATFGILMSLEPAFGALAGFLILSQPMTVLQMLGTALVVAASIGATSGDR